MNRRGIVAVIGRIVVVCVCCKTAAQISDPPWNMGPIGQIGGWCSAVEVDGRYAYTSEGRGNVTIFDVASSSSPVPVGHVSFNGFYVTDILVNGGIAYMTGGTSEGRYGLQILDITNPRIPRILSFYRTPIAAAGVHVTGGLAYVACGTERDWQGGFQIIDVSDASSPTLRGSFFTSPIPAWNIYVAGSIAYLAASNGLNIFDVANPSAPRRLASYDQYYCNDVIVTGGLAYTATDYGLEIVNVTSPTAPTRRGGIGFVQASGLCLSDGLVFLAEFSPTGLRIIDVRNPTSPTLRGSLDTPGFSYAVAVSSGTAYLADGPGGLPIIDVTNPSSPTLLATYETLSDARDVYVADGVAYVANGMRGLKTVDVSNSQSPEIVGSLALPSAADRISISGTTAYICANSGDTPETRQSFLHIVDVTNPSSPSLLGSYLSPLANDVAVCNGLAYIIHNMGFQIVDVSDPTSPTLRGQFSTEQLWTSDIFVSGNLAFLANFSRLHIVDVSDPTSPVLRSSFEPGSSMTNVFVSNGVAYLTGTWTGGDFACLDVSNPDAPRLLGMYDVPSYEYEAGGLSVASGRAYVLLDALRVIDVSDPTSPTLCGFYPTGRSTFASDVFACGDLVYLTDISGLRIFQFTGGPTEASHWRLYR